MNQLDLDPDELSRLLHERASTVQPDLLARATTGARAGQRLRLRRRVGAVAGSALGVAAVVGLGVVLAPGSDPQGAPPGFATAPSTVPSSTTVDSPSPTPSNTLPSTSPAQPRGERLPVSLEAEGWTCDPPADEKFTCANAGVQVLVTVRPANAHDDYLTDPDKADPAQYVSDVHHGVFATINPMPGDTTTDVQALGAQLVWE